MRLDPQVIATLKQITVRGNTTTMPQLDRTLYPKVNKALELLGGKWNRSQQAHVWECDPNEPIANAVATGEVLDWRKEYQFFETPHDLAATVVERAGIKPEHRILEPSAGGGNILLAVYESIPLSHWPKLNVVAVELNPKMQPKLAKYCRGGELHVGKDFLAMNGSLGLFDRIVMNPPFTKGQDIEHVEHAYNHLKPGGKLVAITSPGWTFRNDAKHNNFRSWLHTLDATHEDLPAGTFKESGTMVATTLIEITK
jgi:type I restriction-modification system DNA methylase subunit